MKYLVLLGDGMADLPVPELAGRTPLQVARKPSLDSLAQRSLCGTVRTVPEGMPPGSDTANMAVMGYDPARYYSGRSPIEAVSMGVPLLDGDVAFRCNLVTLGDGVSYQDRVMVDYSSDEISTQDASVLIRAIDSIFGSESIRFYPGKSYRHCMVWKGGPLDSLLTPPHDILTKIIGPHLPSGPGSELLLSFMEDSAALLPEHAVNRARVSAGKRSANSIWIWGQGTRPRMPPLSDRYPIRGSVISAVDLVKGLGICAGLRIVEVPGATGTLETDFAGKAAAAMKEFASGQDYVYLHVEAPDECGHRHEVDGKVHSIERIDAEIASPLLAWLETNRERTGEDYRVLVLPDHPTPLSLRTHTGDPVPFLLYSSDRTEESRTAGRYDEMSCSGTGYHVDQGHGLFDSFVKGTF